mmetsp:Transcript_32603/g.79078  ORF Transcript_32603/g.79078 Transcript_32603/m.79078 type:complete len:118 (-) Transcript_32603:128-481(-)
MGRQSTYSARNPRATVDADPARRGAELSVEGVHVVQGKGGKMVRVEATAEEATELVVAGSVAAVAVARAWVALAAWEADMAAALTAAADTAAAADTRAAAWEDMDAWAVEWAEVDTA